MLIVLALSLGLPSGLATGFSVPEKKLPEKKLSQQLSAIRLRVIALQGNILSGLRDQKQANGNVKKIQVLLKLQHEERDLSQKRMGELGTTVKELEFRRQLLNERIKSQQAAIYRFVATLEGAVHESWGAPETPAVDALEGPRRKILANLADRGLKEIETFRVDLADADQLEEHIQDEKQQLAYMMHDLDEQESVLELNRQLQMDILKKKQNERLAQLENYRKLKSAETQVERLIGDFNARLELERANESERADSRAWSRAGRGFFAQLKGRLPLPVADGRITSNFGRGFDPASRLYVFKKGVDIVPAHGAGGNKLPVRAVGAGKIAFSGTLPDYGRVAIIDHGEHFYSLCAHLGELTKRAGESVAAGDLIGETDDSGTPVYFEIRARNVAVNPLQWLAN